MKLLLPNPRHCVCLSVKHTQAQKHPPIINFSNVRSSQLSDQIADWAVEQSNEENPHDQKQFQ